MMVFDIESCEYFGAININLTVPTHQFTTTHRNSACGLNKIAVETPVYFNITNATS